MDSISEGGSVAWVADEGGEGGTWLAVTMTMGMTEPPSPTPDPVIGLSQALDNQGINWEVPYIGDQPWEGPKNIFPPVVPLGHAIVKGVIFIADHMGGGAIKSVAEAAGTIGVETALDSAKKQHNSLELLKASKSARDQMAAKWGTEADDVALVCTPLQIADGQYHFQLRYGRRWANVAVSKHEGRLKVDSFEEGTLRPRKK
jgi:hypothetical protein